LSQWRHLREKKYLEVYFLKKNKYSLEKERTVRKLMHEEHKAYLYGIFFFRNHLLVHYKKNVSMTSKLYFWLRWKYISRICIFFFESVDHVKKKCFLPASTQKKDILAKNFVVKIYISGKQLFFQRWWNDIFVR